MKRYLILLLVTSGIFSLTVFFLSDTGAVFRGTWLRLPTFNDCDERWDTTMRLWSIQMTFGQLNGRVDKDERQAFRNIKTLDDLWAIFQKYRVMPTAHDEDYSMYKVDGWGQPFKLSVTNMNDSTIIHISSRGPGYYRWVEYSVQDHVCSVRAGPE